MVMMSELKKHFFLSYVLLVGLPLFGLVGILEAGRNLIAPVSVGGVWDLQPDLSVAEAQSCSAWLRLARPVALEISQSGRNLALTLSTLPKVSLQAELNGTELATDLALPASSRVEGSCTNAGRLSLKAEVDPKADPQVLSGVLSMPGCPSCGSIRFRAVKQTLAAGNRSE
jgi:hypothetical protein